MDARLEPGLDDPFLRAVAALPKATRAAVIEGLGAILRAAVQGDHDQPESDHDQHEEEVS